MSRKEIVLEGLEILRQAKEHARNLKQAKEEMLARKGILGNEIAYQKEIEKAAYASSREAYNNLKTRILDSKWIEEVGRYIDNNASSYDDTSHADYSMFGIKIVRHGLGRMAPDGVFDAFFMLNDEEIFGKAKEYLPKRQEELRRKLMELEKSLVEQMAIRDDNENKYEKTSKLLTGKRKKLKELIASSNENVERISEEINSLKKELANSKFNSTDEEIIQEIKQLRELMVAYESKQQEYKKMEEITKQMMNKPEYLAVSEDEIHKVDEKIKKNEDVGRNVLIKLEMSQENLEALKDISEDEEMDLDTKELASKVAEYLNPSKAR